jgi:hypothetical protein
MVAWSGSIESECRAQIGGFTRALRLCIEADVVNDFDQTQRACPTAERQERARAASAANRDLHDGAIINVSNILNIESRRLEWNLPAGQESAKAQQLDDEANRLTDALGNDSRILRFSASIQDYHETDWWSPKGDCYISRWSDASQ